MVFFLMTTLLSSARLGTLVAASAWAASAIAQSGNPAPVKPLAQHDPRLVAFYDQNTHAHAPGAVSISPDGTTLAWTLGGHDGSTLHLTPVASPAEDKIIAPAATGSCSNTSPVWSPDSKTLAYSSTCTGEAATEGHPAQPQVFLYSAATGESRQLTHLAGIFHELAWAPDGKSLAFLFVENATRNAGALAAMKPWSGVIGEDGVEVQRIYSVDTTTGAGTWITPTTLHAYEFGYSPDSHEIAFTAANPPGENNWWISQLYTVATDGSATPKVAFDPNTTTGALHGLQIAVPRFSPDGKRIAFIGGLMSDQGSTGGDVWVVDSKGGNPTDITPGIDGTPAFEVWINNDKIGFVEDRRGHTVLPDYDVAKRALVPNSTIDLGEVTLSGGAIKDAISVSDSGVLAFVQAGHTTPPELWAGSAHALKQITHLNHDTQPLARVESVEWTNEGFHVQGWLTYPKDFDASKKYPIIVQVHGGPSSSAASHWGRSLWAELGYFEFEPNPRGSYGQGEKFTAANVKDFGYGDLRDVLAGMDAIEKKIPAIDHTREGLTGWSYGGFMTMFGVTQTTRFKAAVAGAGISDWQSYYGENSIDQWMLPFFGKTVYDDQAVYAKSSALTFIHKVKTPTLVIVGDRDGECPAPQSFEFWHALRAEGVKTQLIIYPNEGHGFVDQDHIRDRSERMLDWFSTQMGTQTGNQMGTQTGQ
jgi:dipeptidyl aminopeptidase/acylaminoacyl peptidase